MKGQTLWDATMLFFLEVNSTLFQRLITSGQYSDEKNRLCRPKVSSTFRGFGQVSGVFGGGISLGRSLLLSSVLSQL